MCLGEMCEFGGGKRIRTLMRALHCPVRWNILACIGEGEKSTKEIQECLRERNEEMTASCLYYHLSELKKAGLIEVAGYRDERGGAPEKVWRLRARRIVIDLLEGVAEDECDSG